MTWRQFHHCQGLNLGDQQILAVCRQTGMGESGKSRFKQDQSYLCLAEEVLSFRPGGGALLKVTRVKTTRVAANGPKLNRFRSSSGSTV